MFYKGRGGDDGGRKHRRLFSIHCLIALHYAGMRRGDGWPRRKPPGCRCSYVSQSLLGGGSKRCTHWKGPVVGVPGGCSETPPPSVKTWQEMDAGGGRSGAWEMVPHQAVKPEHTATEAVWPTSQGGGCGNAVGRKRAALAAERQSGYEWSDGSAWLRIRTSEEP